MNGWVTALLITAAIVGILLWLRFALRVEVTAAETRMWFCVCRVRFQVYSSLKKKEKKARKEKKPKKAKDKKSSGEGEAKPANEKKKRKLDIWEILRLIGEVGGVVGRLIKRIRVEELTARITAGGDDPAAAAIWYGQLWAVVGSLHGFLDNLITLKKYDVDVELVYGAPKVKAEGVIEIGFRNLYVLAAVYGLIRALWGHRKIFLGSGGSPQKMAKQATADAASGAASEVSDNTKA